MNKYILATDLDGTLLKDDKTVSLDTKNIIHQMIKESHYFVIATGRPFHRIRPIIEDLDIKSDKNFCICFNGALITSTDESIVLYESKLKESEVIELIDLSEQLNISIMVYLKDIILVDNIPSCIDYLNNLNCLKIVDGGKDILRKEKDVYKIIFIGSKDDLIDAKNKIPVHYFDKYNFTTSSDNYLEITSKHINKGNALINLANLLNIDLNNTIAVGDEENDLSMIKKAHLGCCVANANPFVKEQAKYITLSNEEDGVKEIIKKFVLEK